MSKINCKVIMLILMMVVGLNMQVKASANNYSISMNTAKKYIENGDYAWDGFRISGYKEIYDGNLAPYGYCFELIKGTSEGYIIVTYNGNNYTVVEASKNTPSPYKYSINKAVYASPLEYYELLENNNKNFNNLENMLLNIETDETINLEELKVKSFVSKNADILNSYSSITKYLSNYNYNFAAIHQDKSYNCIPTSMAMCLQYLNSVGKIHINIPHVSAIDDAISYRNIMTDDLTNNFNSKPNDTNIRQVMNNFGETYCSPKFSTKGDGFWGDLLFDTIIEEINTNCPFVMMFNANRIPGVNYNENHATTCVGYKIDGSNSYTIVRVPLVYGSGTVPEKEVLWNGTNVHGYYLVYIW